MQPQGRQQSGMTILELAIGMLVLGIFLAGAFSMVVRNNQIARQNQAKLNATQAIRASSDRITPLTREADRLLLNTQADDPDGIPSAVVNLCGQGFFPNRSTGPSTLILRSPVFNPDGTKSNQSNYAVLYADGASHRLLATYVIMRPNGTLDYKRRDEVLIADWAQPKDRNGNALNAFSYFDESGSPINTVTAANVRNIGRIRLSLASQDNDTREKQWSQLTSEIRLANQSSRKNIPFVVYNPNGSSRQLNGIDIVGPTTAVLTRVELGSVAVWTASVNPLTLSPNAQRLAISASPAPTITGMSSQQATLWFTPSSVYTGNYTVRFATTSNDSLSSTFTN
jgi:hypothetical protein